jgi:RNA polymerase sigma factor for flagellar operon FliA
MMALVLRAGTELREIGEVMGVTESRVCQLHSQAIARLRSQFTGELPAAKQRRKEKSVG